MALWSQKKPVVCHPHQQTQTDGALGGWADENISSAVVARWRENKLQTASDVKLRGTSRNRQSGSKFGLFLFIFWLRASLEDLLLVCCVVLRDSTPPTSTAKALDWKLQLDTAWLQLCVRGVRRNQYHKSPTIISFASTESDSPLLPRRWWAGGLDACLVNGMVKLYRISMASYTQMCVCAWVRQWNMVAKLLLTEEKRRLSWSHRKCRTAWDERKRCNCGRTKEKGWEEGYRPGWSHHQTLHWSTMGWT